MRWSVLKEENEAEQMFAWKYLIMPCPQCGKSIKTYAMGGMFARRAPGALPFY